MVDRRRIEHHQDRLPARRDPAAFLQPVQPGWHVGDEPDGSDRLSAGDVDVDRLVGHRGDKVVFGSWYTGIGARERLARANRAERAVHRSVSTRLTMVIWRLDLRQRLAPFTR